MGAKRAVTRAPPKATKPNASEIVPGVFVGGWDDATEFHGTRLCVLDELPKEGAPAEEHVRIYDSTKGPIRPNLERLVGLVDAARARGEPVLMFCGHGVRRSPLAGAWYLHRHEGIPLDAAYERLQAVRPEVERVEKWARHWNVLSEGSKRSVPQ